MRQILILLTFLFLGAASLPAETPLSAEMKAKIDQGVTDLLAQTGPPSASIAVVLDGKLAYAQAYGTARLAEKLKATPEMRYSIGSISKQFTAAGLLLLAQEGKISLDDQLAHWLPELTRARDITLRQLLSMTAGYQDFWPQDYVMPMMRKPVTPQEIASRWGRRPLDFEPGAKWQYSNTNYVIVGLIIEKVSGEPVFSFLQKRILGPLQMKSVVNSDAAALGPGDAQRYLRYAGGPPRIAPKEGSGWMFAAGELAMTASDLARWDISLIDQSLLAPESYHALETEVRLNSGVGSGYGLGVGLSLVNGRRRVSHSGEVSGFTAANDVFPDDRVAVAVLVNMDATGASQQIATKIEDIVFAKSDPATPAALDRMRSIFTALQHGELDRSLLTDNANAYFTKEAIADYATALGALGEPEKFEQTGQGLRGGMTFRRYEIKFPKKMLRLTAYLLPDGKIEQYQIAPAE